MLCAIRYGTHLNTPPGPDAASTPFAYSVPVHTPICPYPHSASIVVSWLLYLPRLVSACYVQYVVRDVPMRNEISEVPFFKHFLRRWFGVDSRRVSRRGSCSAAAHSQNYRGVSVDECPRDFRDGGDWHILLATS